MTGFMPSRRTHARLFIWSFSLEVTGNSSSNSIGQPDSFTMLPHVELWAVMKIFQLPNSLDQNSDSTAYFGRGN